MSPSATAYSPVHSSCHPLSIPPTPQSPPITTPPQLARKHIKRDHNEDNWLDSFIVSQTRLEEYRVIKTLGQGTFGKVRLCQHLQSMNYVAIKYMEKARVKNSKQKASIQREVRLLMLLRHPHIINVLDVIETGDRICIVMEHLPKGELFYHIVKNHHLTECEARKIMQQLVSAIEYCHNHSIMHRDLKPENLLLDNDLNVKLIDFGLGNTFDGRTPLDTFCGSPFYASPQMIRGVKYFSPEADVWSLGVIMFAMLSGRLPFDAEDQPRLYERIASGIFRCPSFFSNDATDLIQHMLVVNPSQRYTIEQVKKHPWIQWEQVPTLLKDGPHIDSMTRSLTIPYRNDVISILQSFGYTHSNILHTLSSTHQRHPICGYYRLLISALELNPSLFNLPLASDSQYFSTDQIDSSISTSSGSSPITSMGSKRYDNNPPSISHHLAWESCDSSHTRSVPHKAKVQNPTHSPVVTSISKSNDNNNNDHNLSVIPIPRHETSLPLPTYRTQVLTLFLEHSLTLMTQHSYHNLQKYIDKNIFIHGVNGRWLTPWRVHCKVESSSWDIELAQVPPKLVPTCGIVIPSITTTNWWSACFVRVQGNGASNVSLFLLNKIKSDLDQVKAS